MSFASELKKNYEQDAAIGEMLVTAGIRATEKAVIKTAVAPFAFTTAFCRTTWSVLTPTKVPAALEPNPFENSPDPLGG